MSVTARAEQTLPRDRSSPRHVRALVARVLSDAGRDAGHDEDQVRLAQLLASELATNAVRHGCGATFGVEVVAHDGEVTVRVHDDALEPPQHRVPAGDDLQRGGWGLDLVDRLAQEWGVEPAPDGKVVWFTLGRDHR